MDRSLNKTNTLFVGLAATALGVEWVLAIAAFLSRWPIAVDATFVHSIIWHYQRNFQPQQNLFFYALATGLTVVIYACLWAWIKWSRRAIDLKAFLMLHALVVVLMGHAAFAVVALHDPLWAWPIFWTAFAVACLGTVFWTEFVSILSKLEQRASLKIKPWMGWALACVFIFLVIFMPDLQAIVAMVYMGDYFHNWDASLFGGVYAITQGAIPFVDVNITYGLGASVMLAKLVNLMGGFDYARLLGVVMWVGIVYFILWFFLLRRFLSSTLLAFAAVVFAIRMQMFNSMIEPFIWVEIMHSVFRVCFDVGVFWMLWMHLQTRRTNFLLAAAFFVSLGIFYMLQTGTYMFLVFLLYTIASAFIPVLGGGRNVLGWRNHALAIGSVVLWTGLWFYLSVGAHLFEPSFFKNLGGYSSYFIKGAFETPLTTPLLGNNVFSGVMGLLYPVFYLVTLLYVAGQVMRAQARKNDVFAGLLSFYGLLVHSYYMLMVTQWYTTGIPGIFLLFYWLTKVLEKLPVYWPKRIAWGLVVLSVYCLTTARLFTGYPNLLNFSRNPIVDERTAFRVGPHQIPYFHQLLADFPESFKLPLNSLGQKEEGLKYESDFVDDDALKSYYAEQTAWPQDVALIERLTPQDGRAAVLSSFEVLLLEEARRRPFFYYFPLLNSRPLDVRNFMVTCLFCYPQLEQTLGSLEAEKPSYIFMERIFLTKQVPQAYFYEYDDLIVLLRYVLAHYEPVEVGKYLVAMKRRQERNP